MGSSDTVSWHSDIAVERGCLQVWWTFYSWKLLSRFTAIANLFSAIFLTKFLFHRHIIWCRRLIWRDLADTCISKFVFMKLAFIANFTSAWYDVSSQHCQVCFCLRYVNFHCVARLRLACLPPSLSLIVFAWRVIIVLSWQVYLLVVRRHPTLPSLFSPGVTSTYTAK